MHVVNVVSSMKSRSMELEQDTAPPSELLLQSWNRQFATYASALLGVNLFVPVRSWLEILSRSLLVPNTSENCVRFALNSLRSAKFRSFFGRRRKKSIFACYEIYCSNG